MKITPEQFVSVLQSTSLTHEQQKIIIEMLPHLTEEQIQQFYQILLKDSQQTKQILDEFAVNLESEMQQLGLKIEQLEKQAPNQ